MEITVVIPAFNEEKRLPQTLQEIRVYLSGRFRNYEVLVVDDGSRDNTASVCAEIAKHWPQLCCLTGFPHQGKGACVKRGCLQAKGENILVLDADHAIPISNIENSLALRDRGYELIAGMRAFSGEEGVYGMGRRIIGLIQLLFAHLIVFQKPVTDSQCGYKFFSHRAAQEIFGQTLIRGAMYDVEVIFLAQKLGLPVFPQPVVWFNKRGSSNNIVLCSLKAPFELLAIRFFYLFAKYKISSKN